MTRPQHDEIRHDPRRIRASVDGWVCSAPELSPAGFDRGYRPHGFGRRSRKLPGLKLRKAVTDGRSSSWPRPGFVTGYMTGSADDPAHPLPLAAHGVPPWLLRIGFGHGEMYRHRVAERPGRSSLAGTTVRDPARLPGHPAADEHHADWAGREGYVATTAGGGRILGIASTPAADDAHLQEAYGVFAAEARDVDPGYAPEAVNTDGRAAARNASRGPFPSIAVVLRFLHGSLKVRDRCRKARDLHRRVWDAYRAATAEEFRRPVNGFQRWWATETRPAPVGEMLAKPWGRTESYAAAYDHPGCHRTSDAADRPMNRLCRPMDAGRGSHGHPGSSELRPRGRGLLENSRPYAPRGKCPRAFESPAHRLDGKRDHEHWPRNLMASTSLMGVRNPKPAIR